MMPCKVKVENLCSKLNEPLITVRISSLFISYLPFRLTDLYPFGHHGTMLHWNHPGPARSASLALTFEAGVM